MLKRIQNICFRVSLFLFVLLCLGSLCIRIVYSPAFRNNLFKVRSRQNDAKSISLDESPNSLDLNSSNPSLESVENLVQATQNFCVFSISTPVGKNVDYRYVFYAPLAVLAWKRIQFNSIVIISGSEEEWNAAPPLKLIRKKLDQLGAIVLFFESPVEYLTSFSQLSRIFTASLASRFLNDTDYLVTSDSDML